MSSCDLHELAREVITLATSRQIQLATAESLTGGMLGNLLCSVAGASAVYRGGVISYANEVKSGVLGVSETLLQTQGSVDPEVAWQMSAGAARVCDADFALSTTGVAGPDPHDGKPVGRVYLGLTTPKGSQSVERNFSGSRQQIREESARVGLLLLQEALQE